MLLVEDDFETKQRIISAVCMTPAEIHCASTVTAGLFWLDSNDFDVIVIDRHLGGWVTAKSCRGLVARAGGKPAVGLINEDCVVDIQDAIEAGLTGVYYKEEMNIHLMRRLGRLAYLPSVAVLAETSAASFGSARS
jgi:DNA-binding response OmpR family regulator